MSEESSNPDDLHLDLPVVRIPRADMVESDLDLLRACAIRADGFIFVPSEDLVVTSDGVVYDVANLSPSVLSKFFQELD